MSAFSQRLGRLQALAGLSICDLAAWIDGISEGAVRTWLKGVEPQVYTRARVGKALDYLEKEIRRQRGHIVPLGIRQRDRRDYVRHLRSRYPNV